MSDELPSPERRRALAKLIPATIEGLETDAAEFRRLVRSFARRPQMVFLRELLRSGPAKRSPENEAAWKGLRNAILPVLEKGEVQESELPWFLSWVSRVTVTKMPRVEFRPEFRRDGPPGERGALPPPDRTRWGERFDRSGPPGARPGGPGGPGGGGGRPPFRGGPGGPGGPGGRGGGRGPDRDRDRGGPVRMPAGPKEVDTRWDALKSFKLGEDDKKDKK